MESYFQHFDNYKFSDIYKNFETFKADYESIGIPAKLSKEENVQTLYYLLLAKYSNSTILNYDTNQFKLLLFMKIFEYGPTWEKRLEIQDELRKLSLENGSDIFRGSTAIYNKALNPATEPSTNDLEALPFINEQNTTNYKKSKLDGLAYLDSLIKTDVTEAFLDKFRDLFKKIIYSGRTLLYVTEEE